jgi:hypothetical protein
MGIYFGRSIVLASACFAVLLAGAGRAIAQNQPAASSSTEAGSLMRFLQTLDDDRTTRYAAGFVDLNGDGTPEAIVHLMGRAWCGSGGCTTLILVLSNGRWEIVTKITITRPPIRVLKERSNGWLNIGIWVRGGGVQAAYEAELRYNGKTYPTNPSTPPARRIGGNAAGRIVVPLSKGDLLYR